MPFCIKSSNIVQYKSNLASLLLLCVKQKKYLEALKKYEEVILLKRDTYGDRSETVSQSLWNL